MKIAILCHNLMSPGGASVGKAIIGTLPLLTPQHEYYITYPDDGRYSSVIKEIGGLENVILSRYSGKSFFNRKKYEKKVSAYLDLKKYEWVWWLGNMGLNFPKLKKQSLLLQSAYYLNYHHSNFGVSCFSKFYLKIIFHKLLIRKTIKHCAHFYVQTECLRNRFHKTYNIELEKISLFPASISFDCWNVETNHIDPRINICKKDSSKFKLFYVSGGTPNKNHERIIEMFRKFSKELSDVVCYFSLDKEKYPLFDNKIKKFQLCNNIKFLGLLPFEQLSFFYKVVDCCFFPSLLETVGLGMLEAMYFGLPVIASDIDFAHTTCGDAAYYVNPFSLEDMKNGIIKIKTDSNLREKLSCLGKKVIKAKVCSWKDNLYSVLDEEGIIY